MDYQKIILVGNTTDVPKVQKTKDKMAYADFIVAVNRNKEEADFFPVRVFGKLTETAAKINKGAKVLVEGKVEISRFTPEQGESRTYIRVLANTIRFV